MEIELMRFKSATSVLLILALTLFFAAGSMASPDFSANTDASINTGWLADLETIKYAEPVGMLTTKGTVKVNGNEAHTGATVLSTDIIKTDDHSEAIIDFGLLGRIQIRSNTEIKVTLSPKLIEVDMFNCGTLIQSTPLDVKVVTRRVDPEDIHVAVLVGEAIVKMEDSDDLIKMKAGDDDNKEIDDFESITATGDVTFTLGCDDFVPFIFFWPGWTGVIVTAGTVVGVKTGVDIGDEDPPTSPIVP